MVALWYGLTGLAAAVRFRGTLRTDPLRALPAVVAPLLSGVVLFGLAGYLAWTWIDGTDHFAFTPDNGWFLLSVPAAMFLSGMVMAAVGKWSASPPTSCPAAVATRHPSTSIRRVPRWSRAPPLDRLTPEDTPPDTSSNPDRRPP